MKTRCTWTKCRVLTLKSKKIFRSISIWWGTRFIIALLRKVRVKPTMTKLQQFEPIIQTETSPKSPTRTPSIFTPTWISPSQLQMAWGTQYCFIKMMKLQGAKRKWVEALRLILRMSHTKSRKLKKSSWPHLSSQFWKELSRTLATRSASLRSKPRSSNLKYRKKMLWSKNIKQWPWNPAECLKNEVKVP